MQSLKIEPLSVLGKKQVFSEVADKGTPTIMTRLWKYITRLWKYKTQPWKYKTRLWK